MEALFICGIFMSFVIAFLLLTKISKALSDKILAAWVIIIGIHLLNYYLYQLGYWERYPHLVGIAAPFPLLHGPFLYLYTLYSLRSDNSMRKIDFLHFLPVLLVYTYMSRFFFFYTAKQKALIDSGQSNDFALFTSILLVAFVLSGLTYPVLAYRLTWKHKRKIDNNFSYDEGINLNWLRNCIYAIGVVYLIVAVILSMRHIFHTPFTFNADYIFYSILIFFIFYLGYFGIRHQDMFSNNVEALTNSEASLSEKYKRSTLKEENIQQLHQELITYMSEQKPHLSPKLSLSELAKKLNTTTHQLSQVINQKEQVNFHDFINQYRIEEFIKRALHDNQFSILAHALDAGFNSKSSFNSVFKKLKGQTPTQYLASLENKHA